MDEKRPSRFGTDRKIDPTDSELMSACRLLFRA